MLIEEELMKKQISYIEFISEFFTCNYSELIDIANKDCVNTDFAPEDILSELYLYLADNKTKVLQLKKLEGKEDKPLIRYCAQWIYNNIRLFSANAGQSNFQSKFSAKKENEPDAELSHSEKPESTEEDVWLINNFSPEDQQKIKQIDNILKSKLTETEKKLYNMIYVKNMNVPRIMEQIPEISKYSLYKMIKGLMEKIKRLLKVKPKKKNVFNADKLERKKKENQRHYQKYKERIKKRSKRNYQKSKKQS